MREFHGRTFVALTVAACALSLPGMTASGAGLPEPEGAIHAFPGVYDANGKRLADGEFRQWLENGKLHVQILYDFGAGHRAEEKAVFRQNPVLVQEEWSWDEFRDAVSVRHFTVDFSSGKAAAEKEGKRWSEEFKLEAGETFAGFGFTLALKSLRERLVHGEKIQLKAVAFTPKPRVVSVTLSFGERDKVMMAGRAIEGDRFGIHPEIPRIAKLFVEVQDTRIWLTVPRPAGFLRWEGALVEPDDPLIRVDLLPGSKSAPAEPVGH